MSLNVLAAAYDDPADALAEFESIKAAYAHAPTWPTG